MLDNIGNNMLLSLTCADFSGGKQSLIVSLASSSSEDDLLRISAYAVGNGLASLKKSLGGILSDCVQGRRVTVIVSKIRHHRFKRRFAELCCCGVISVYCSHGITILSFNFLFR